MSLAERLLQWPQAVARQVFTAVMVPAADMHPAQARQAVPQALWAVSPVHLSKALNQGTPADWHSAIDGRQISHKLALLPTEVVGQVAWITPAGASGNRTPGVGVRFPADEKSRQLKLRIEQILGSHLGSERPTQTV